MKIVLDTNIMLVCIARKSPYNWIFQKLLQGEFTLCVTTDIIDEYAEIIERIMSAAVAEATLEMILNLQNVVKIDLYYRWNLLQDVEDNKFVDCAIASNAHYIVSHDKDFNVLKTLSFPKLTVISAAQFKHLFTA